MIRIGTGYDLHRLEEGGQLVLGGVTVPHDKGLVGHSDADALVHAVIDALLGATALGNIGILYPDSDPAFKDVDSLTLLASTQELITGKGFEIANIDSTIVCEAPKLNPHLDRMRENLARCLHLPLESVSVKAKTNEGVGPEGRGEAISVHAVALVQHAHS